MSTRLVLRGRTAWANADWYKEQRLSREFTKTNRAQQDLAKELEDNPPPLAERSPMLPGFPFHDDVEKITYRVVTIRLDPTAGWVTLTTVMRWYSIEKETVFAWVRRGVLDAAIEHGSPTRRYRVLDPATCNREGNARTVAETSVPTLKRGRRKP